MRRYGVLKKVFAKHKYLNESNAKPGVHDFVIVLDRLKPDFNVGKVFRGADAFGAREVDLINVPFFNVFPARGSFKHVPARFYSNFNEVYERYSSEGYTFFTLEPNETESLVDVQLPKKSAFVFGHEEFGLSFNRKDYPNVRGISIPQFGKVQSLNVSIAASLVMFEYVRQHGQKPLPVFNGDDVSAAQIST